MASGEARRVAVLADVADDVEAVRANPEKMQPVLFNLIQNAIRHTPADGGRIWLERASGGTRVRFSLPAAG